MCFYKCSGLLNFYMWIWMKSRKRGIKKDLVVTKNKDTKMRKQRLEELFDYNVQTENYWHASVGNWQYFRHIFTTRRLWRHQTWHAWLKWVYLNKGLHWLNISGATREQPPACQVQCLLSDSFCNEWKMSNQAWKISITIMIWW